MFWKYAANLQENAHAKVRFQWSCKAQHFFLRKPLDGCFCSSSLSELCSFLIKKVKKKQPPDALYIKKLWSENVRKPLDFMLKWNRWNVIVIFLKAAIPDNIYLFKLNSRNFKKKCEICSKLTMKTAENLTDVVLVFLLTSNIFDTFL